VSTRGEMRDALRDAMALVTAAVVSDDGSDAFPVALDLVRTRSDEDLRAYLERLASTLDLTAMLASVVVDLFADAKGMPPESVVRIIGEGLERRIP